jgi:lipopolysaccharide/colanic/teichoic acid biosynthesis glycosyltransferase
MSLKKHQKVIKRLLDIILSFFGLVLSFPFLIIILISSSLDTKSFGIISQTRIGRFGRPFKLYKFKTMRDTNQPQMYITTIDDPRITRFGRILRKLKLDEIPQLWNVLIADMSFVGPRPDVPGYADKLKGEDRIILQVKPGITGPASLAFKDEEELLAKKQNPKKYNDEVIWPEKVKINKEYIKQFSIYTDIKYILKTITISLH